jgi:hypothetical protein
MAPDRLRVVGSLIALGVMVYLLRKVKASPASPRTTFWPTALRILVVGIALILLFLFLGSRS